MILRFPHPVVLLLGGVGLAAALTWLIPAGAYDRRTDPATGRMVAVAGTYHTVSASPVGLFRAAVAVPRGIVEGGEVIATILFVGAAFFLVDKVGTLSRLLGGLVGRLRGRDHWALPAIALFFALMGALENMQEEIIALVPALLLVGRRLGVDAVAVVAASAGAAIIGSAFGPTNPFQAGIALTLAELPPLAGGGVRLGMLLVGVAAWIGWTLRYTRRHPIAREASEGNRVPVRADLVIVAAMLLPLAAYVYGALRLDWGFNELSGAFLLGAILAGGAARLGTAGTTTTLLEGMQAMLPAAILVGIARSISVVLTDGRIIDTILHALVTPLQQVPATASALLMIPFHAAVHIPVSSVSGQAALTMPILVPLSDLVGLSRQVTVLAYQTGGGLMDLLTPTNGALMAVLLAAGVPYQRWLRFALGGWLLTTVVGVAGVVAALALGL